jgi:hypothetical protein
MSNALGQGLFSADGPLFLWHDFMQRALNEPWEWNGNEPVPQGRFDQPDGVVTADVCRFSGMAATNRCGRIINLPFLEGTVPPPDNVHPNGCLDLELYVGQAVPDRPSTWIEAADRWSDRLVNGQTGASGDPADYQENPNVRFAIAPAYGERGWEAICGERVARPRPSQTPRPSGGGGGGGNPCRPTPCTPPPSGDGDGNSLPVAPPVVGGMAPAFAVATAAGGATYLRAWRRRGGRHRAD